MTNYKEIVTKAIVSKDFSILWNRIKKALT